MFRTWPLLLSVLVGCASAPKRSSPSAKPEPAFRVRDGVVASFVLPTGDGHAVLVDCGMDPDAKALREALARHHMAPADVQAIFITHRHADHVGGCVGFPGAKRYAFLLDGEAGDEQPLHDGQVVTVGRLAVRAYATPGHTSDSGAFVADGVAYLGDAATSTPDGKAVKPSAFIFSGAERRTDDTQQNAAPLAKLHARLRADGLVVRELAFAHSGSVFDVDALIRPVPPK